MIKKEANLVRPVHRINLTLPIVRTDAYEIYCTVPPAQTQLLSNTRLLAHEKPNNQTTRVRSLDHLKYVTGPVVVRLFIEMPLMAIDSSSTVVGSVSNALINSGYSGQALRVIPTMAKHNKHQPDKDDSKRSRSQSDDKLLYESVESFEEPFMNKTKNGMWQNVHQPQVTKPKILHQRKTLKHDFGSGYMDLRVPNTSSLGNLSEESIISSTERLHKRVEQLTKTYFPTIQQIRQTHLCPELINNRMHLHREEQRNFVPKFSRSRVV
jgi:hypothetical protein